MIVSAPAYPDIAAVARIELARPAGCREGHMQDFDRAGFGRPLGTVRNQRRRFAQLSGTIAQQVLITQDHDTRLRAVAAGEFQAQIGPYAGRLAGGNRDDRAQRSSRRYST